MDNIGINGEIHFLINLPNYLKQKQNELDTIDDYITLPSLSVDETGTLSSGGSSIHVQAMSVNKRRCRIKRQMKAAKKKSSLLVKAIKSLNESDIKRLIEHYTTDNKECIEDLFQSIETSIQLQTNK